MEFSDKSILIAQCGMNCGLCHAYLREKNKCPGCRLFNAEKPITIARCKIRNCEVIQKNKLEFCFECDSFPCERLENLDKRYRTKYNMSMIDNLECIRDNGIDNFLENEELKWICNECGGTICVHKGYCYNCKKKYFGV